MPVFLPGESPWTEEHDKLPSMGLQSRTRLSDRTHKTSVTCLEKSQFTFSVKCLVDSELSLHFSIISLNLHFHWQFFKYNFQTLLTI